MPNTKGKRKGKAANKSGSVAGINDELWLASREENVMRVQVAIAAGADVNYVRDDYTCLMRAAYGAV
jgi:hypothetical protein